MARRTPRFALRSPELLRTLMQHTGTGDSVSIRDLAAATGIPVSTVGAISAGAQRTVDVDVASAIADRIGVDLLVLWLPDQRSVRALAATHQPRDTA